MLKLVTIAFIATLWVSIAANAPSLADESLSDGQRQEIETLIGDYLRDNPEVLIEALEVYRTRQESLEQDRIAAAIGSMTGSFADNPAIPVAGNPDGNFTIVEFFDYRCGFCKRVFPALKEVISTDDDIRLVLIEFPILGEDSVFAARAALATWFNWPERYMAYHDALMATRGTLSRDTVLGEAARLGIDPDSLSAAMGAEQIDQAIQANYAMAQQLSINGTPAFIIGNELVPGAIELAEFRRLIAEQRDG